MKLADKSSVSRMYRFLHLIFRALFSFLFRAEIQGTEKVPAKGAVILAANHMSNWDPPLLATFLHRPVCYMAKEELFEVPLLGTIITQCYSFPVRRGTGDRGAIKAAVKILKEGHCMGMFPEGTRSHNGKVHKAEAGVGLIAAMTGAVVVPATIIGTDRIFSGGHFLPKLRVIYGEPMQFSGNPKSKDDLMAFSQSIMDHIARTKSEYEQQK